MSRSLSARVLHHTTSILHTSKLYSLLDTSRRLIGRSTYVTSNFEFSDRVARCYDHQRVAMGSGIMAAAIQFHCGKPFKDIHVLDAGCGTGNYAVDFLKYGVGQMTLLDASAGMLIKAKSKLSSHIESGRINDVIEGHLPTIPFSDNTFDAILFNMVLHHLEAPTDSREFRSATNTLQEGKRVLKPGGLIIISTSLPQIFKHSVWFTQINTKLTDRYIKIYPYLEEWETMFEITEMTCVQKINLLGSSLMVDYCNYEGPLDEDWRRAISYWSHATNKEIEEVQTFIALLKDNGELETWVKAHNHLDINGPITIFALMKEQ